MRVKIMGSQTCRIVGKYQSVIIVINPIIFTRTRTDCAPQLCTACINPAAESRARRCTERDVLPQSGRPPRAPYPGQQRWQLRLVPPTIATAGVATVARAYTGPHLRTSHTRASHAHRMFCQSGISATSCTLRACLSK
jgi:hypothetical protein